MARRYRNSDIHLTNDQYKSLLGKIKETVSSPAFIARGEDSNDPGYKHTTSNCGLCNNNFTTAETALFPADYPDRKSMKYRLGEHVCPFDKRMGEDGVNFSYSCFYDCRVFSRSNPVTQQEAVELVEKAIELAERLA